ncbi:MAG: DsbA family oxidoreductase [Betaproteobacteria bacterium]|nr:DsbA family oxidoreductase [Betaproteobacteria bacterium]
MLEIEVISDVVCPWCFIGKRRLEAALARYAEVHPAAETPRVLWKPFQLNPGLPESGMDRAEYVTRKFGAQGPAFYAGVAAVGKSLGIEFAFDRIARQPNTVAAHSLIALAHDHGRQDEIVEALFRAYFLDGADLTRSEVLSGIVFAAGLPLDAVTACLADPQARRRVEQENAWAQAIGVTGVPFFVINRRFAGSGAQEPEFLLQALDRAAEAAPAGAES